MNLLSFRSPINTLLNLKRITSYSTLLICSLLPSYAFSFDDTGIEVSGQGSVVVIPDQFSLTLTITERGRVPNKLKALVDKKSNSVVNAAKSLAVKDRNITSARVNLRIVEEKPSIQVQGLELNNARQGSVYIDGQSINQQTNTVNGQKRPLFELSRQITVNFNKIDDYDSFITKIIKINVSHISSLSMSVEGRDEYYQQALLKAISHARKKAQRMAEQAGRKIEKLQLIREQSSNHYRPMYAEAMMKDSSPRAHSSLIGSQSITARVLVKFSLQD
ncbi:SIMPL domain-containing protein [Colwellia sp. Bg11-28]|uniref:SIMPL domain-containing protein n=1 Tax=Colwellia sp. Bg11-28 TaxID=2058305 RepID=UPI000C329A23|nr:SIMPL domain-containing protein [Colwellia sp. Bg11-28]PKH87425.1 SIMPL domain-containing protein [Colwellia sp. Bg11-28]